MSSLPCISTETILDQHTLNIIGRVNRLTIRTNNSRNNKHSFVCTIIVYTNLFQQLVSKCTYELNDLLTVLREQP